MNIFIYKKGLQLQQEKLKMSQSCLKSVFFYFFMLRCKKCKIKKGDNMENKDGDSKRIFLEKMRQLGKGGRNKVTLVQCRYLINLIKNHNLDELKQIHECFKFIFDMQLGNNTKAIFWALPTYNKKIIEYIFVNTINPFVVNHSGLTLIHSAAQTNYEIFQYILKKYKSQNQLKIDILGCATSEELQKERPLILKNRKIVDKGIKKFLNEIYRVEAFPNNKQRSLTSPLWADFEQLPKETSKSQDSKKRKRLSKKNSLPTIQKQPNNKSGSPVKKVKKLGDRDITKEIRLKYPLENVFEEVKTKTNLLEFSENESVGSTSFNLEDFLEPDEPERKRCKTGANIGGNGNGGNGDGGNIFDSKIDDGGYAFETNGEIDGMSDISNGDFGFKDGDFFSELDKDGTNKDIPDVGMSGGKDDFRGNDSNDGMSDDEFGYGGNNPYNDLFSF